MQSTAEVPQRRAERFDATVDYITAYWQPEDAHGFPERSILEAINGEVKAGNTEQRRSQRGIEWFGAGATWLGTRGDERYHRAHGPSAHRTWEESALSCTSLSRLDLALTCHQGADELQTAAEAYRESCSAPATRGRPSKKLLIQNNEGGQTFALGSRRSDVYLRLYDWGVAHQTAAAGCCWRYEAELKGSVATRHAAFLLSSTQRELAIAAIVRTLFTDRSVTVPIVSEALRIDMRPQPPSTVDRKLAWLSKQVRPALRKLYDAGYLESALEALGVFDMVERDSLNYKRYSDGNR